jgi:hypothetical protein
MRRPTSTGRKAVALALALGLAVAGCSDGGDLEELVSGGSAASSPSTASSAPSSSSSSAPTTGSTTTSTSTTVEAGEEDDEVEVSVLDVQVGQCFEEPTSATEVETVLVVPCTTAHTYEVFAVWELTGGGAYPGDQVVLDQADAGCLERFAPYVGAEYAASALTYAYFYPLEREWTTVGDRGVACFAYRTDGAPLTATVAGSGL